MMAAAVVTERGGGPCSSGPAVADYSVLVVVGSLRPVGLLERLLQQIDSGKLWGSKSVPESQRAGSPRGLSQ